MLNRFGACLASPNLSQAVPQNPAAGRYSSTTASYRTWTGYSGPGLPHFHDISNLLHAKVLIFCGVSVEPVFPFITGRGMEKISACLPM